MTQEDFKRYEFPNKRAYDHRVVDAKFKSATLWLTRAAADLWREMLAQKLESHWLVEAEELVRLAALEDWGENTACKFDREKRTIEVENLDGRLERI